jgi:hypothetical protein
MSAELGELTSDTRAMVRKLLAYATRLGLTVRIDSTRRTCAEQAALYEQGRTTPGAIVTNARGCGSYHVLGRAVDIYVGSWNCADYEALGKYWESLGGTWGGRFALRDCVHFEWPHGTLTLNELCPPGLSCEAAVALQPPSLLPSTVVLLGAAVGASAALVLLGRR